MKRLLHLSLRVAAVLLVFHAVTEVSAQTRLSFKLVISGDPNVPTFQFFHQTPGDIQFTKFEFTVGHTGRGFDSITNLTSPTGGLSTRIRPDGDDGGGERSGTLEINFSGFDFGEWVRWRSDVDDQNSNKGRDYRNVFFNNTADQPNSILTVTARLPDGTVVEESLTLPDGAPTESSYTFLSEARPQTLQVSSVIEDTEAEFVGKVDVKINGTEVGTDIGTANFDVAEGDTVEITAPSVVYKNTAGEDITEISELDTGRIADEADERFTAIGISVNNVAETGDPTRYSFEVERSTNVVVKWQHEFALVIQQEFQDTESAERKQPGSSEPFVPRLTSEAEGNPSPSVNKHWIPRGDSITASINGELLDFSNPGLGVRFVPKGYIAYGPPNTVDTPRSNATATGDDRAETFYPSHTFDLFAGNDVPQRVPDRHQVKSFVMDAAAGITFVWGLQYGVTVNVDDPGRSGLPRIFDDSSSPEVLEQLEGTFWFDPGADIVVATAANENPNPTSRALNGWLNGDAFYFSSNGDVDTQTGELTLGGPLSENGTPVATWVNAFTAGGITYRGLSIQGLRRPLRVLWRYGQQAITDDVELGGYVFEGDPRENTFTSEPTQIEQIAVTGANPNPDREMAIWDPVAKRLYPTVPGIFRARWKSSPTATEASDVLVTVLPPQVPHYPHVANTPPVALDPDPNDDFIFKELRYSENEAVVNSDNEFTANSRGLSVLLFSEIQPNGRGVPREFLRVRVAETQRWTDTLPSSAGTAVIGKKIEDGLDLAQIGTGYVRDPNGRARFNPFIYDVEKLNGLAAQDVYDMEALRSNAGSKIVVNRDSLPGPIIPVNLFPGAGANDRLNIVWYDDPAQNDNLLWPYKAQTYNPVWPTTASEGLGKIVIASEFGSESQTGNPLGDQEVVGAVGEFPAETTYNPTRLQQVSVYSQPDPSAPGYNPNEEHGLVAPSLRFVEVSPRPPAIYALRNNDLNFFNPASLAETAQNASSYTSHPRVLVQFFDVADQEFKMRVYEVEAEDAAAGYTFASRTAITPTEVQQQAPIIGFLGDIPILRQFFGEFFVDFFIQSSATALNNMPHVTMEAGEPVIPFYPLVEVIGASPCPETFGTNLDGPNLQPGQTTYWEDHKGTSWAVAGGENAWFTVSFYYPMAEDFWWPADEPGFVREVVTNDVSQKTAEFPQSGDCVAFLPSDLSSLRNKTDGAVVTASSLSDDLKPRPILYKSEWPKIAPTLKAGETLTFQGGEFRADRPTTPIVDDDGEVKIVDTPGLPGIVGFAVAEVVFDSLNPSQEPLTWKDSWTARVAQVLDVRSVVLSIDDFPSELQPANGLTRVSGGKYVFNDLPASLQKRIRYNPLSVSTDPRTGLQVNGTLEIIGLLNDKDIGDPSLTAAPPAVYVLEPNILTATDVEALKALDDNDGSAFDRAIDRLFVRSQNPNGLTDGSSREITDEYLVGLEGAPVRNPTTQEPILVPVEPGSTVTKPRRLAAIPHPERAFGPGLALVPNSDFLNPEGQLPDGSPLPDISWVTVVENNDPSQGGSPVTVHVIRVDQRERYRGAIKTVESDNVFDENLVLRHTGDFGANPGALFFEWYYRPDDGREFPPPDLLPPGVTSPWKVFPDPSGRRGQGRYEITLKGNPNAPEALLADTFWFVRYRHSLDNADGTDWSVPQPDGREGVNFTWAGAGNSDPFNDFDFDGVPDFKAQLAQGWIKRVLDAVNPYEARIREFEGDHPDIRTSMLTQLGPRFEGPVALNPSKNVIENVGLIELYDTILKRGRDLSIDLSRPVSTPAIANALQLASTRISDFYTVLGNEAFVDALDHSLGHGAPGIGAGSQNPVIHPFQNQVANLLEEELGMWRGVDDGFARPVYNRFFWNFTKGLGEAAYVQTYNVTDINLDGFINEDDAMELYPQGHGDAWGHYLTALRTQYELLKNENFNWVSRSEFYNLQDIVIKVDFLDERKFAQAAAARAKTGAHTVNITYRSQYVSDPNGQWQGYTDSLKDRSWGVQGWARRASQGAYFDWVTANALLPSEHPNSTLTGIQKVDRQTNSDISVISANLNAIQRTFDEANNGKNPLGVDENAVPFDIDPQRTDRGSRITATHFEQIYERAVAALANARAIWVNGNANRSRLRTLANSEAEFRNHTFQQDLTYRNRLIKIFGKPYEGTVGPGRLYPAGFEGPDTQLFMYVDVREITNDTVPGPTLSFASFNSTGNLTGGEIHDAFDDGEGTREAQPGETRSPLKQIITFSNNKRELYAPTFHNPSDGPAPYSVRDGWYNVNYTDLVSPKVELDNLTQLFPIKASGYTFQAPKVWGSRPATGELQVLISRMIQQEAQIARAIGAWDALSGEIGRAFRLANASIVTQESAFARKLTLESLRAISNTIVQGFRIAKKLAETGEEVTKLTLEAGETAIPENLPTGGLAVSPGDALSAVRAGFNIAESVATVGFGAGELGLFVAENVEEVIFRVLEFATLIQSEIEARDQSHRELLKSLEDRVGDEPVLRIEIFKQIEALRDLSARYRSLVDEGARLIDERVAFNKRVAAQTQRNRYQDMTFRVSRNAAMQQYRDAFNLAARYAFLAAKAYDYETNLDPSHPASARAHYNGIVSTRGLGQFADGQPRIGDGGLGQILATMKANYDAIQGQLGFNNPQLENGKISLRTENFRILPKGSSQPENNSDFPSNGTPSDDLWRDTLEIARVDDLWEVPEYRYFCRPFSAERDAGGTHITEPGLVLRFSTEINSGKNFFGHPLSGGDHAYDPTNFSTKIRSLGVWFSDYRSDDVLSDLSETPRVYLIPVGVDVMRVPSALPNMVRSWNVVDQRIPTPFPSKSSDLDVSNFIPLLDTLNGRLGEPRRFSSFRAYHDGGNSVNDDELVSDSRLIGRSIWNSQWVLIIPGRSLNADPAVGINRFRNQVSDIKLVFETYGHSGG